MPREKAELEVVSYGAAIALRLRELREDRGWSMEKFRDKLAELGVTRKGERIPLSTCYSWERGSDNSGADLPLELYGVIAKLYGFTKVADWLPSMSVSRAVSRA